VRIANVDCHLNHIFQAGTAFLQSQNQVRHHHFCLRTEIIRRQDFAGGIGGDLTGTEDELIRSLGGHDVRIVGERFVRVCR
jgi:hypothetical protein